jgi:uncharacterized LabA/DUF88 family protein
MRDVLVWLPKVMATRSFLFEKGSPEELQRLGVRAYYYASTTGGEDVVGVVRRKLWHIGFQPVVFKKPKNRLATKGVDIALTTDLLGNAYRDNYDVAVLIAGDGDYVPLVEEVKRLGKIVHVAFFWTEGSGLSPELQLASDVFWPLDDIFVDSWQQYSPNE